MIVTSNLPFESWTEVLGSEWLTGATLDRLTHRCRIIETKGESYRLRDGRESARAITRHCRRDGIKHGFSGRLTTDRSAPVFDDRARSFWMIVHTEYELASRNRQGG
jgi:hypothetical protein